jgi:hypothetical protein
MTSYRENDFLVEYEKYLDTFCFHKVSARLENFFFYKQLSFNVYISMYHYFRVFFIAHAGRTNEERLPQKNWNGVHLEEEEKEDLEMCRCRKQQLE